MPATLTFGMGINFKAVPGASQLSFSQVEFDLSSRKQVDPIPTLTTVGEADREDLDFNTAKPLEQAGVGGVRKLHRESPSEKEADENRRKNLTVDLVLGEW